MVRSRSDDVTTRTPPTRQDESSAGYTDKPLLSSARAFEKGDFQKERSGFESSVPGLLTFVGKNEHGYDEYLNRKDSSIMVRIPAGKFRMGHNKAKDQTNNYYSWREVHVPEFYIDKYEISNRQYLRFCRETGHPRQEDPRPSFPRMTDYSASYPNYPATNIYYTDAQAYCIWAGKQLPSDVQWEKAARGTDGRQFPWGNEAPDGERCNFTVWDEKAPPDLPGTDNVDGYARTAPVTSFPLGASPYGVFNMAGNVCEWCTDWRDLSRPRESMYVESLGVAPGQKHALRGGTWAGSEQDMQSSLRGYPWYPLIWGMIGLRGVIVP
jgi:formylglycine-generating enzyme required for sulfatase activity